MLYTVYIDREGGKYFTWYYDYEGEKQWFETGTVGEAKRKIKSLLSGLPYKIVMVQPNTKIIVNENNILKFLFR